MEKWKKEVKDLKNQNKMLYSIAKKSGSRHKIKKIKNIRAEASNKTSFSSSEDRDSDYSLARNISCYKHRLTVGRKEIKKLDTVVTYNLNNYNNQSNEAIDNEPTFDNSSFNLYSGTRDHLPVVTVYLQGGKKHRENVFAGLT